MKRKTLAYLAVLFVLVQVPGPLHAQDPEADSLIALAAELSEQAMALYEQGQYAEAIPLAERELAIREAHSSEDDPRLGDSLSNLALYYSGVDRYAEAEPLLTRALGISEAALGSNHPDVALKLNDLGVLYANTGRYQEAIPVYQRSLEILNALIDPDDLEEFFDT